MQKLCRFIQNTSANKNVSCVSNWPINSTYCNGKEKNLGRGDLQESKSANGKLKNGTMLGDLVVKGGIQQKRLVRGSSLP